MTALDLITGALQEINAVAQGESASPGDADFALNKLNDLLDEWAARRVFIYDVSLPAYALVPGLAPHTIGPLGELTQSSRANDVATYICANNFQNGQSVTVVSTNGLSGTGNVQAATAAQFSIALAGGNVGLAADNGTAVLASSAVPTFATPNIGQRPQRVEAANLILTDQQPNVELPLNVRDEQWWMAQRIKGLETNIPTDVYYDPTFPNGSLFFWPLPNFAYGVRLKLWGAIPQFPSAAYAFSLPPGYSKGVKLSLARDMVGPFQGTWSPTQEDAWKQAMKAIEANNIKSPRGRTADAGMPGTARVGEFNYYSGMPNPGASN